jgi:hypothetical protein
LIDAPDVLGISLSLPGKDRDSDGGNGSGSVILSTVDVARRPSDLSTCFILKRLIYTEEGEGLDKDSSLDSHVQASSDTGALKWLSWSILLPEGHESWHLVLCLMLEKSISYQQSQSLCDQSQRE